MMTAALRICRRVAPEDERQQLSRPHGVYVGRRAGRLLNLPPEQRFIERLL